MIINYDQQIKHLTKIRKGEITEGLGLDIPEIDNYIRFKEGSFNICLGHANVGKTTLLLYLMLCYSIQHKKRWLVFSSENEPYSIIRKIIEFIARKPLDQITDDKFKELQEWVSLYFKFISNERMYTYKDIIALADNIKDAWDYHGLLIDPYNSLVKEHELMKSVGGHEYDYQACTELRMFCKKRQVTTWVNTHANTAALRFKHNIAHEYAGYPIPPMASDVEGGGKFVNRADDFIVIHRYTQHPSEWMYSHIHVRKIKEIETGGRPTMMDEPIRLRASKNNVGFEIDGKDVLHSLQLPF